ncbi:MAG: SCO family protein [Verrucomicrobiota bacterium]
MSLPSTIASRASMQTERLSVAERGVAGLSRFLAGGRFAAFALFALFFYQVLIGLIVFSPMGDGVIGKFLEEFRVRCFRLNPENGWMDWSSVWVMLAEPVPLEFFLFFLWRAPLRQLWKQQRSALIAPAGAALAIVSLIGVTLLGLGRVDPPPPAPLPFPAERLRTALPMPGFHLIDQDDQSVSLDRLKDRVVLLTAVYSTCTTTCPMMLTNIREVLNQLTPEERAQLTVVAFSLNPEADTRELRAMTSQMYGMKAPQFHFVSGLPAEVNALLDELNVARQRDEKTGQIMHSNLFFLLDRQGRIAYRLSQSQREQAWLLSAVRVLLHEKP